MILTKSLLAISLLLLIASCKKKDTTDSSVALQTNFTNVAYGTHAAQAMDVYLPPNRNMSETKVLVMIHGGGWSSGDKTDMNAYVDTFRRRFPDYAIFNLNYRLAGPAVNLFPSQEQDIKAAIEFIYFKREAYAISDKFALIGASAGAHLALLQAYKYETPVKIKAVIDFFGPADMKAMYTDPAFPGGDAVILNVTGTTPSLDSVLYAQSSPINFIVATSTPTFILHGGADMIVRPAQSDSLFARLDSANVVATYVKYPTQNHGWYGDTLSNSFNIIQPFLISRMQ